MPPAGELRRCLALPLLLAALLTALLATPAIAEPPEASEYELKAAMLANVVRLVEWPAMKPADSSAPLAICVINSAEMEAAFEKTVSRSPMAGARRMTLRKMRGGGAMAGCDAVFFGGTDRKKIEPVLRGAAGQPLLTTGENDRFTAWGGIVGLLIRDDHLEVEVNLAAAEQAGLTISSRLLRIAVIRGGGGS
jgi:hypothetical protein